MPVINPNAKLPNASRLDGIAAFREGVWNGQRITNADLRAMVDNFKKYSSGTNPYYRPFVSLKHDDALNAGFVDGASMDANNVLKLNAWNVPNEVADWVKSKRLHAPSIEFWAPVRDANGVLIDGFVKPDGTLCDTPVLKCVTLLGNDAPAVKGLGDLPNPTRQFSQSGKVHKYGGLAMDRAAMLAQLQSFGMDVSQVTDVVPDAILAAIIAMVQAMAQPKGDAAAPAAPPTDDGASLVPFADLGAPAAMPAAPMAAPASPSPSGLPATPNTITYKFKDAAGVERLGVMAVPAELQAMFASQRAVLSGLAAQSAAVAADLKRQRDVSKGLAIQAFSDRMKGRYTPAQLAAFALTMRTLDHDTPRKFADGKTTGTALEEAISVYERVAPDKRTDREIMKQDAPANGGSNTPTAEWEARQAKILAADPFFAAKARKAAAGK